MKHHLGVLADRGMISLLSRRPATLGQRETRVEDQRRLGIGHVILKIQILRVGGLAAVKQVALIEAACRCQVLVMVLAVANELGVVALHLLAADGAELHRSPPCLGLASVVAVQFVYRRSLLLCPRFWQCPRLIAHLNIGL